MRRELDRWLPLMFCQRRIPFPSLSLSLYRSSSSSSEELKGLPPSAAYDFSSSELLSLLPSCDPICRGAGLGGCGGRASGGMEIDMIYDWWRRRKDGWVGKALTDG